MSDAPKKPESPAEQWRAVMLTGLGEEARELEEASDAMIDDELELQGFDPAALEAEGNALAARLLREAAGLPAEPEAPPPAVVSGPTAAALESSPDVAASGARPAPADPVTAEAQVYALPPRPRPRWPLLLVAAAVAAAAIGTGVTIARKDEPPPKPPQLPDPSPPRNERPPEAVAASLRQDAERDCRDGKWDACSAKLNQAADLDPAGEQAPHVKDLRVQIVKALSPPPTPPNDKPTAPKPTH